MPVSNTQVLTLALAAVLVAGTLDSAAARHRKQSVRTGSTPEAAFRSELVPMENGVPVIMKGYRPPRLTPAGVAAATARRPRCENPARQQHLHSAAQSVSLFEQQPARRGADPAGTRALQPATDHHLQRSGEQCHPCLSAGEGHRQQSARPAGVYSPAPDEIRHLLYPQDIKGRCGRGPAIGLGRFVPAHDWLADLSER